MIQTEKILTFDSFFYLEREGRHGLIQQKELLFNNIFFEFLLGFSKIKIPHRHTPTPMIIENIRKICFILLFLKIRITNPSRLGAKFYEIDDISLLCWDEIFCNGVRCFLSFQMVTMNGEYSFFSK